MLVYKDGVITKSENRRPNADEVGFIYIASPTAEEIEQLVGKTFGCHPLVVEKCQTWDQRPGIDGYDKYMYMSFYVLKDTWDLYEMSLVVAANYLIAIFPEKVPFVDEIKENLMHFPNKMKSAGLLLYEILNSCIHYYLDLIDEVEDQVDDMENQIYENPYVRLAPKIFNMKRKLHKVRRTFTEERDMLTTLMHEQLFGDEEVRYLADILQHTNQVIEMVDTFRDSLTGLLELQMSLKGDKMNEIMKTLTVVNTIFLPMMFIVGYYGTNLHLPEYGWAKNDYWLWGWLLASVIFMIFFFKRKKWM